MSYRVNQPELTEEILLERLEAIVPNLRARAQETERLRYVPEESLREIRDAGYLHAFRPVHFGGSGLGLSALCNGARILAHGCASTAWTASFLAEHQWFLGKASLSIQEELMGDARPGLMAGALAKLGTAEPVPAEGDRPAGYLVTARSDWNSAIEHSDWTNFKAKVGDVDYMFMVPKSDVVVEDVWHTTGMRGTSSNTITADRVFVPEHLATPSAAMMGTVADPVHKDEPFASYPFSPVVSIMCVGTVVGAAEEAVEVFAQRLKDRVLAFSGGAKQVDQQVAQMRLGDVVKECRKSDNWIARRTRAQSIKTVSPDISRMVTALLHPFGGFQFGNDIQQ